MNSLWICDPDTLFCERLTSYAEKRSAFPFGIQPFSSMDTLISALQKKQPDAVLLSEEFYKEKDWQDFDKPLFLLGNGVGRAEGPEPIFRYQEADALLKDVLARYQKQVPLQVHSGLKAHFLLIGVMSPTEGAAPEHFALEMAERMGYGEQVLLLDLTAWPVLENLTGKKSEERLGELLYYLCKKPEELMDQILLKTQNYRGISYLPTATCPEDLLQVEMPDYKRLFDTLRTESPYTLVFIVFGQLLQPVEDFIVLLDRVYLLTEAGQEEVTAVFEAYLKDRNAKEAEKRLTKIHLLNGQKGSVDINGMKRQISEILQGRSK